TLRGLLKIGSRTRQCVVCWMFLRTMTKRLPEPAYDRHSGARPSREPGIQYHERGLWIPGPHQGARPGMTSARGGGHGARAPLPTLLGLALALFAAAPASAQGKLDARYEVTLAGIPVGKGAWVVDIADDQYSASASGATSGLLKAFASGSGTGASQGRVVNGALLPLAYSATVNSKKSETIRMSLASC